MKFIKEKNLNVLDISRKTTIPYSRIYKWLSDKGKPKEEDAIKLKKWASGLKMDKKEDDLANVPNLTQKDTSSHKPDYFQVKYIEEVEKSKFYLERENERLFNLLSISLSTEKDYSRYSLAYLKSFAEMAADRESGGNEATKQKELVKMNKLVASKLGVGAQMDTPLEKGK